MHDELDTDRLIAKMRGRIDQCLRLAAATHDRHAAKVLRDMAAEGEADVAKLEAERKRGA